MRLDTEFIESIRSRVETAILPIMETLYGHGKRMFPDDFRPEFKFIERVVSYYDYWASGISILARIAARGDDRAMELVQEVLKNADYYRETFYGKPVGDRSIWTVPLRRLLLHIALAYDVLKDTLSDSERQRIIDLVEEQVPVAIEHCSNFLPGVTDLHLKPVNNHTAIFAQGIYYCGKIFGHSEWVDQTREFAKRYYDSGHPDGYFEEHTNEAREGGPSMVYTPLTAGCLYDILDGPRQRQEKFIRAGNFYRAFLNSRYERIPIADERANHAGVHLGYGMALHSLTPRGRGYIVDILSSADFSKATSETLAVIHHELDLLVTGDCEAPENRVDGNSRITLPLGVVRKGPWTAGLSGLLALNRLTRNAQSDYALDQQNMVYLDHRDIGVILSGIKSKNNPAFSTFRVGQDAYTVRTGKLEMSVDRAEATLFYQTFTATIIWELSDSIAKLILRADTTSPVTTTLPVVHADCARSETPFQRIQLPGFSPYTENNAAGWVEALRFEWKHELVIEFTA